MIMTRMRWLLVAWWCAAVVPGLVVALLFPDDLANDDDDEADVSSTSSAGLQRNERSAAASVPPASQGQQTSGRVIWKFTSWHGPTSTTPDRTKPPKRPKAAADPAQPAYALYAPTPADGENRDLTGELRELAALHERGQLTDDEFTLAKRRLLGGAEDSAPPE